MRLETIFEPTFLRNDTHLNIVFNQTPHIHITLKMFLKIDIV